LRALNSGAQKCKKLAKRSRTPGEYPSFLQKRLDPLLNSRQMSPNNFSDLLSSLKEHESRHRPHTQLLCDIIELVNINLVELDIGVDIAPLLDLGRDSLAGTAPFSVAV
jgi:hypothetical protein